MERDHSLLGSCRFVVIDSGCWIWIGHINDSGYGMLKHQGLTTRAHRHSYSIYIGPIPAGMHVLHKCDVRSCVNPDHLFLGTNQDNVDDREGKGRGNQWKVRGSKHCRARLCEAQVLFMRGSSASASELADVFGVSAKTVYDILSGRKWGWMLADE